MTSRYEIHIKLVFGCLNCDKPIPMSIATKGIQLCSKKCLKEINKEGGHFELWEAWKK